MSVLQCCESSTAVLVHGDEPRLWCDLADNPSAGLFTSRPWIDSVASTYGFQVSASASVRRSRFEAALFFAHLHDFRGERIVSYPFCDYCDPVVADWTTWHRLVDPLLAQQVPVVFRCLRSTLPEQDPRFKPVHRVAWHGLDLTPPSDALWASFRSVARTAIRRAQNRLRVREGRSIEDLRIFYDLHCHIRRARYRLLPQPFAFFEALHARFAPHERLTIMIAEDHQGVAVGATAFIEWADTLYYKFNASLDRSAAPNDLLVWEGTQLGKRRGLKLLDFGASDLDQPGLIRFKEKYATERREIIHYRWEPPGYADPVGRKADRALGSIAWLFTDPGVPDSIVKQAGEVLYGFFG